MWKRQPFAHSKLGILQLRLNVAIFCAYLLFSYAVVGPKPGWVGAGRGLYVTMLASLVGWRILDGVQNLLDRFEPESAVEAKRLNEQIKLLAGMLNTVAAAAVSILAIAEIAKKPSEPNMPLIIGAIGAGLWVHFGARGLLLHLKDDAASAYQDQGNRPG